MCSSCPGPKPLARRPSARGPQKPPSFPPGLPAACGHCPSPGRGEWPAGLSAPSSPWAPVAGGRFTPSLTPPPCSSSSSSSSSWCCGGSVPAPQRAFQRGCASRRSATRLAEKRCARRREGAIGSGWCGPAPSGPGSASVTARPPSWFHLSLEARGLPARGSTGGPPAFKGPAAPRGGRACSRGRAVPAGLGQAPADPGFVVFFSLFFFFPSCHILPSDPKVKQLLVECLLDLRSHRWDQRIPIKQKLSRLCFCHCCQHLSMSLTDFPKICENTGAYGTQRHHCRTESISQYILDMQCKWELTLLFHAFEQAPSYSFIKVLC